MIISKQHKHKGLKTLLIGFILMNTVAFFHAYKFTHFTDKKVTKTGDAKHLALGEKFKALFFGIDNPRPMNKTIPSQRYETVTIQSNKRLEAWLIKTDSAKGTVLFFHGFSGEKSEMLKRANEFVKLGYNALLVDFMGSGNSEGSQTTVGFKEAEEVKSCFDYVKQQGEKTIYLFGTSMGAAAIMKAEHDYKMNPKALILECPFGSMYQTVCARFSRMGVPSFPMAGLLVFWGGVQNGFWAFAHNPIKYAKTIECPVLLMYGRKDETVSEAETQQIFNNFKSAQKELKIYSNAAHENFLNRYGAEWQENVAVFMKKTH